ncbi:MAG TPA: methionine adenosyltransferase, partial [Candidatus Brevibacterium intestinigallinarum]|nr:methionine adenosyltransferase [Candidatus Brevibacterium intestinigallinarum]
MTSPYLRHFTSESVTEGHPDKICDQISDAVLDSLLSQDPDSKVAVETLVTTGLVHVAGEVRSNGYADVASLVRDVITGIGYDSSDKGFDGHSCGVSVSIGAQSSDISAGIETSFERRSGTSDDSDHGTSLGAGDQGLMFGYADDSTAVLMPLPIHLAHRLSERLSQVRRDGLLPELRPDGKTQVTIGYDGDEAVSLEAVVVSSQHDRDYALPQLTADLQEAVIAPVLAEVELDTSR